MSAPSKEPDRLPPNEPLSSTSNASVDTSTDSASGPAKPRVFGDYILVERLGRGGFGKVYRAVHAPSGRACAIKVLAEELRQSVKAIARFEEEARVGASLKHPHIVAASELRRHKGIPYIVMQHVEGSNLAVRLARKPMPPRDAVSLLRPIAEAVQHLHTRGILHRDIKPSNIMIETKSGKPYLLDLGLAKDEANEVQVSGFGDVFGTKPYMPPEQIDPVLGKFSAATDVYALGVTLYEMLVGTPPFPRRDKENVDLATQIAWYKPIPPSRLTPDIPADLDRVCAVCLQKSQYDRYSSAAELATDLQRYLDGKPVEARVPGRAKRALRLCQRRPWESFGVAVLTLLALGGAGVAWHFSGIADESNAKLAEVAPTLEAAKTEVTREQGLRRDAQEATAEAQTARDQAKQAAEARRRALAMRGYAKDMQEIARSWEAGDLTRVRHLLDQNIAKAPADDLRGFEWYYWDRRLSAVCDRYTLEGDIRGVATNPKGDVLLGATNRWAVAWDTRTQRELFRHEIGPGPRIGHLFDEARQRAAISPDGLLFAVTNPTQRGGELRVWNRAGEPQLFVSQDSRLSGYAAAFSPNGAHLLASGLGGEWLAWSTSNFKEETPECRRVLGVTAKNPELHPTTDLWFASERELHVFGNGLGLWFWTSDMVPGFGRPSAGVKPVLAVTPTLHMVTRAIDEFGVSGENSTVGRPMLSEMRPSATFRHRDKIVVGCNDKVVRTWGVPIMEDSLVFSPTELRGATGNIVVVSRAGHTTVAACDDNAICVWPGRHSSHIEDWPGDAPSKWQAIRRAGPTAQEHQDAIRSGDLSVLEQKSREVDRLTGDSRSSPSRRFRVEHDANTGRGTVLDERGHERATFTGRRYGYDVGPIRWSRDERYVAIACSNQGVGLNLAAIDRSVPRRLLVLDVAEGKQIAEFTVAEKSAPICDFSPDGTRMCVSVSSGTTELWSLPDVKREQAIDFRAELAVFSGSGRWLALASTDETRVWSTDAGSWSHQGKPGAARLVFTPNERTLMCVPDGNHTRLVLLDLASGDEVIANFSFLHTADLPMAIHGERLYTWSGSTLSVYWADMIEEGPLLQSENWTNLPDDSAHLGDGLGILLGEWSSTANERQGDRDEED